MAWVVPLVMVAFGVLVGIGMIYVREQTGLAHDTVIGVFFALAIGFGAMLFQVLAVKSSFNPEHFLFGNLVFVPEEDLVYLCGLVLVVAPLFAWRYNQLIFASFNPTPGADARLVDEGQQLPLHHSAGTGREPVDHGRRRICSSMPY